MSTNSFRDRLLNSEPLSAEFQSRFDRELESLMKPRLTRGQRWYYVAFLIGLMLAFLNSIILLIVFRQSAIITGIALLAGVLCAFATVMVVQFLRHGFENFSLQQQIGKALPGISLTITFGCLIYVGQDLDSPSLLWPALGFLMFLLTSFINLYNRTVAAERTSLEHLLRVEYRLVELSERLTK